MSLSYRTRQVIGSITMWSFFFQNTLVFALPTDIQKHDQFKTDTNIQQSGNTYNISTGTNVNDMGINAQYGFFEKLDFDTKFDLIISINALDHMPYPMEILHKIYDSLEDDGKIYFELPNRNEALNFFLPEVNQKNFNTFFWIIFIY